MNMNSSGTLMSGQVLDDEFELDFAAVVRACRLDREQVIALVESGLLEPRGEQPATWRFRGIDLTRARLAQRLTQDLDINLEGAAVIVELLEERDALRKQMRMLSALLDERIIDDE
jgi:chaperone modulatory protein CbpM